MSDWQNIIFDSRWNGANGIGRFAQEIEKRFPDSQKLSGWVGASSPLSPFWLSGKIRYRQADVLFSPGYVPPIWSKIPFIFTIHDLNHIDRSENSSILKRIFYERIIKPGCYRASKILTVSEFSKQRIKEWSGIEDEKIMVVGNGVDNSFTTVGNKWTPGFRYMFYVGNRKPHKNIPRMLRAFSQSGIYKKYKLVMTGIKDTGILNLANELNISESIIFAGKITDKDLPQYYRGADALILPSLYEGFGLPIIEAMSCGIPVITSNCASMPEVSGDAALLVNPESVGEISVGMRKIVQEEGLRTKLITKGLIQSNKYSWSNVASRIHSVLREVMNNGRNRN